MSSVSVIVPTYNRASLLGPTLQSILAQTVPPEEVIVIDDGSTDATASVVAQFGSAVTYIRTENQGVCRARKLGLERAKGDWIALCDSDDLWLPNKLEVQMGLLNVDPDIGFSFGNFSIVQNGVWESRTKLDDAPQGWLSSLDAEETEAYFLFRKPIFQGLLEFQPIFPSTLMVSCKLMKRVGGIDERIGRVLSEDLEFSLRCARHPPIGFVKAPLVGIRKHDSNRSGYQADVLLGEVAVLSHARAHYSLGEDETRAVDREVERRRVEAANLYFSEGRYDDFARIARILPFRAKPAKFLVKQVLASLM